MREEETPGKHSWHQWTWHHTGAKLKTLNVETRDFQNKTASMARHELGLVSLSEILRPACLTPTTTVWTSAAHLDHAFYANISLICMLRFMPYIHTLKKKTLSLKSIFQHVDVSSLFTSTGNTGSLQDDNYTPTPTPEYDDDYDYNATFDYYYGNSTGATQHSDC